MPVDLCGGKLAHMHSQCRITHVLMQGTALLTLLLDTGRLRYSSTPERGATPSPTPPPSLAYTSFGRKMLQFSIFCASTPNTGGWLHGLPMSKVGATEEDLSESGAGAVLHSADHGTGWVCFVHIMGALSYDLVWCKGKDRCSCSSNAP